MASIGIVLFLLGAIDKFWWLIVTGLYGITYLLSENEKITVLDSYRWSFEDGENELMNLINSNDKVLPSEAMVILHQLQLNLNDLNYFFKKNSNWLIQNEEINTIQNIFENYLPNIINKYMSLPKRYAETVVIKDNKTTKDFLIEQLSLLESNLKKTSHSIYENDSKALVVNGRFLKEKFSTDDLDSLFQETAENKEMSINNI
jgi:hypothetical protein